MISMPQTVAIGSVVLSYIINPSLYYLSLNLLPSMVHVTFPMQNKWLVFILFLMNFL